MSWVFKKHYTRDEARNLLPEVKIWLERLVGLNQRLSSYDQQMARALELGDDLGGEPVDTYVTTIAEVQYVLSQFKVRDIQIKDLQRGLIDFPSFVAGKEVFLCWQKGENDIEYWHDLESGYAGRELLE